MPHRTGVAHSEQILRSKKGSIMAKLKVAKVVLHPRLALDAIISHNGHVS